MSLPKAILIEIDDQTFSSHLNQIEQWLGNVLILQLCLNRLLEKAKSEMEEPHLSEAIRKMADANKAHEESVQSLFEMIGRRSTKAKDMVMAEMISLLEGGLLQFVNWNGGAIGSWQYLNQLLIMNQQTMGAFAIAEQLALAMGLKEMAVKTFEIVHEKNMHYLLLKEYMLEMAPISILYKRDV